MPDERVASTESRYRTEDIKTLPMPDTLFGLLDAIRERPGMYIGRKSLRDFWVWLWGYRFARLHMKVAPLPDESEFERFDFFVCEKYRWHDVGGWAAKIAYYHRDDADAFDEFFKLLDEFRATKPPQPKSRRPRAANRRNAT
jgi:hypothetical protein